MNTHHPQHQAFGPSGLGQTSGFASGLNGHVLEGAGGAPVRLVVSNSTTQLQGVHPQLQLLIDHFTRYPTDQAVEAGPDGWKPPEASMGEAYWDGWIHLAQFRADFSGTVPTGLLDLVLWICDRYGYPYELLDHRIAPLPDVPIHFEPLVDRDYQLRAVEEFLQHGRGVLDMPPRSGKTRTGAEIWRCLNLRMCWIAPKSNIVEATVRTFNDLMGKHTAYLLKGTKNWQDCLGNKAVITTYKTAESLPQEFWDTREMLVIDEFHHAAAKGLRAIAKRAENVYYRLGMTGTFTRSGDDAIAMHSVLSRTIVKVEASELVDRGYLVPAKVLLLPMDCPKVKAPKGRTYVDGVGRVGVTENDYRNALAAWAAEVMFRAGRKVLVLVSTKEQGRRIENLMRENIPKRPGNSFQPIEFVSTDRPSKMNQAVIDAYNEPESPVRCLIGTSLVSEGTDLPPCDALIYAVGRRAEVELVQAAYRVCTKHGDKALSYIIDFVDSHHPKLLEHAKERVEHYFNQPTFDVHVLENAGDLLSELSVDKQAQP